LERNLVNNNQLQSKKVMIDILGCIIQISDFVYSYCSVKYLLHILARRTSGTC